MTKFSLNSRRKKIHIFLFILVSLVFFAGGLDILLSLAFNKQIMAVKSIIEESGGYYLDFRFAYVNIFAGLTIKDLKCGKDSQVFFAASEINTGFDVFSLFQKKKLLIKNINVTSPQVYPNKISETISLWSGVLRRLRQPVGFFETTYFKGTQVSLDDAALLDVKGYLSSIKGNLLISRGSMVFKKIRLSAAPDADFFAESSFYKPFDYVFEAEMKDRDFVISRFELSNPILKFTGSGSIQDVLGHPQASLEVNFLNVVLDDFPALNNQYMQARGVVDSVLKVKGPLNDLKTLLNVKISNAQFTFFDSIFLSKINGSAIISSDHMVGQNFSLEVNSIPLVADFAFYQRQYPHLLLELSSRSQTPETSAFVLNLSADWVEDELVGDIKSRLRYSSKETANTMDFYLSDFHLGYEDDVFINARNLRVKLLAEPASPGAASVNFNKELSLQHFFCVVRRQENGFALDHLKSTCYGGTLEGEVDFVPKGEQLVVKGEGHLRDVELKEFFKEVQEGPYVLLGVLDGDLKFDNVAADMFKGQLFVKNGLIAHNPLLNAVADFLGVSSLKKVGFKELSVFFNGGKGEYSSQIKLDAPQVNGILDGRVSSYDKMDGFLTVNLATELLNESKQFKKILTYIRHDEPSVTFPFKISSYIHSPRVLWLKNEFKGKLQNLLPERNKRFLQQQVNKMVEKIEEE